MRLGFCGRPEPGSMYPVGVPGRGSRARATMALIAANVAVYLYTSYQNAFIQSTDQSVEALGFYPALFLAGSPQGVARIFTSMFTHADIFHIFFNMYFLWLFGKAVEGALGAKRYLALYILSGIAAAVFHAAYVPIGGYGTLLIPAVGASGAISGVLGAYLLLYPHTRLSMCTFFLFFPLCFNLPSYAFMIFWFATQVVYGYLRLSAVATFAHVGGFVFGMLLGWRLARDTVPRIRQDTSISIEDILRSFGIIARVPRGLGPMAKTILALLVAAVIAGFAYSALALAASPPMLYVVKASSNNATDSLVLAISDGSASITTSLVDDVRILVNRLRADLLYNPALAGKTVSYDERYRVEVSGVEVPVVLKATATYDSAGVLSSASGVMATNVVYVNPYAGVSALGRAMTLEFSLSASPLQVLPSLIAIEVGASVISGLAIVAIKRSDEVSLVQEEVRPLIPFV